jgi:hypothetical protein
MSSAGVELRFYLLYVQAQFTCVSHILRTFWYQRALCLSAYRSRSACSTIRLRIRVHRIRILVVSSHSVSIHVVVDYWLNIANCLVKITLLQYT